MPQTVRANAYDRIKRNIIFGAYRPAEKLKLEALKQQCGASVSTLRETLSRLASDGFVVEEEQRGFHVAPVSAEDLTEIAALRALLECTALKTSIENGGAEWEGGIVAAHHKLGLMEERMLAGDTSQKETWKRYDSEFHQAMIAACNSKNLLQLHSRIYEKYLRYQMLVLTFRGKEAAGEHKNMLRAALNRNAAQAEKVLRQHIANGIRQPLAMLKKSAAKTK
jgi:DNA-binding GntR family transcriptional regulator